MARLALCVTLAIAMPVLAHAEIAVDADVPFTAGDLAGALALRGMTAGDLEVRMVSPTAIELRTVVGSQRVELGATRGAAAARIVALQIATLQSPVPGSQPDSFRAGEALARSAPWGYATGDDAGWTVEVAAGGGIGVAAIDFALTALRAGVVANYHGLRIGGSMEWLHGLEKTAMAAGRTVPATADLGALRAVVGIAAGRLEVVGGPELVPYRVSHASSGVTVGLGGSVRVRLLRGAGWQAFASANVDGFLHRVIVDLDGMQLAATPRVALTAALGLAWGGT